MSRKFWTDTKLSDIQSNIKYRQGVCDYQIYSRRCRTTIILEYIEKLISEGKINHYFTLIDLFCGDAIIIRLLKEHFDRAVIIGVDINKIDGHQEAIEYGVEIKYQYVHDYIKDRKEPVDIVLMMNTYRNIKASGMTKQEFSKINKWLLKYAAHPIVTTSNIKKAKKDGFNPLVIGKGEGSSDMVDLKGCFYG